MKMFNRIAAAIVIFVIVLGNLTVFTCGDTASSHVVEFAENFDVSSGIYTETFANGRQFTSTVPEGGKTYDGVILNIPKDISAVLSCDGTAAAFKSGEPIYGKGYYILTAASTDVISGEAVCGYFTFRIMGEPAAGVYNAQYDAQMISCVNTVESDGATGLYKYSFPNCKAFYSSISQYGENVPQANFILPKNLGYSLKRNGSQISYKNNETITAAGSYTMSVYAKNYGITSEYARVYKTDLDFTIIDKSVTDEIYESVQSGISNTQSGSSGIINITEDVTEASTERIISDTLSESYNSEANLYKETFSNGEGFYANIENEGLSGGNVYIDIPSNMTVSMTKDGIETQYLNKAYVNEQGTYILNIVSSSDGTKYEARFKFRIQKGIEASADAVDEDDSDAEESADVFDEDYLYETADSYSVVNEFDEEKDRFVFNVGSERFYANMPSGMFANSSLKLEMSDDLDYSITRDGEDYDASELIEESGNYTVYVSDKYGNSLETSFYLYANPVNSFDSFTAPGGYYITSLEYSDYKNNYGFDEEADDVRLPEEETEQETGEADDMQDEESAADETDEEENNDVSAGAEMINLQAKRALSKGLEVLVMPLDGRYTIELKGEELPALQTEIVIDKTPPVVDFEGLKSNMKSKGNEVSINCDDDEATLYLFPKSGDEKILGEGGGSAVISGVGQYTLIAVDRAGNQSEYTFKITRHIGAAGVGAILLLAAIIVGICMFVAYSSKKFSVR